MSKSLIRIAQSASLFACALGVLFACESEPEPAGPAQAGSGGSGGGSGVAGSMAGGVGGMSGASSGAGGGAGASSGAAGTGGGAGDSGGTGGFAGGGGGGGSAGSGGVGGSSGSGGGGGSAGGGACTPGVGPGAGKTYATTGWKAQWSVPCDFETNGGCQGVLPPEKAFDGKGDTRSSIGDTHIKAGSPTAQLIGDSFTFDMASCNQIGKLVMFAAAPPNNNGSFDARDFPGTVEVTVSSDCSTSAQGVISGTFGAVVATASEAKPGCQNDCNMPMTIDIDPPVAAKCVKLELTKVLQLGGGIWWAIDELQTFP